MLLRMLWSILVAIPFQVITSLLLIRVPNWTLPPGPLANWLPIVGSLPLFAVNPSYHVLTRMAKKYGKLFRLKLGSTTFIVICDPDLLREAFNMDSFSGRNTPPLMDNMNHQGIINSEGKLMRNQRSLIDRVMLNLTFRNDVTRKNFVNRTFDAIAELLEELEGSGGQPIAIDMELSFTVVNIIFGTLVRTHFYREDQVLMSIIHATHTSFQRKELISFANFIPSLAHLPTHRKAQRVLSERKLAFRNYVQNIVQKHQDELDLDNPKDLIDAFLAKMFEPDEEQNQFYTESQLYAVLYDIFSTSLETVSATILWLLLAILKHPHVQEHLEDELNEIVDRFEMARLDQRDDMPYLEATIMEGLRFSSILPIGVSHSAINDINIQGYHIPNNSMVVGLFWKIHRDPALWKNDPNTFNPTNHLSDRGFLKKSPDLMPFSTGSRSCLGDHVALSVIYLVLANVLHKFRIEEQDGVELPSLDDCVGGIYRKPLPFKIRFIRR